jgi:hypothetical protein
MSTPLTVPPRPIRALLVRSDAHTPDEDILLVRSSSRNPIGSCYRGIAIPPGGLGYQTRATVEAWPMSAVLHPYVPAPSVQVAPPADTAPVPSLADWSWAAPTEPTPPPKAPSPRVLSAKEAVAFIREAGPGEYDHFRTDPRRSVKDAVEERDHDHATAGG